ncbi:von willebrand factor type a domain containing protein [Stylonychia lemnae]|uniref:von willebrand factor type a domain containing protein n=1 Tax=Stylonychia lemnae TaxID=5949 RepID=A0A078AQW8_STYLE|nr:von willebrand factor type a domain containing protein [Stylonychia lemnae]|eukprot:CDW83637.1 von willebrand factor type a domain containing protein [Stylonychia lemnae]
MYIEIIKEKVSNLSKVLLLEKRNAQQFTYEGNKSDIKQREQMQKQSQQSQNKNNYSSKNCPLNDPRLEGFELKQQDFCVRDMTGEVCFEMNKKQQVSNVEIDKKISTIDYLFEKESKPVIKSLFYGSAASKIIKTYQINVGDLVRVELTVPLDFNNQAYQNVIVGELSPINNTYNLSFRICEPSIFRRILPTVIIAEIIRYRGQEDEECPQGQEPCALCLTNKRKIFYNCGHLCTCLACDLKLRGFRGQCPICRETIECREYVYA